MNRVATPVFCFCSPAPAPTNSSFYDAKAAYETSTHTPESLGVQMISMGRTDAAFNRNSKGIGKEFDHSTQLSWLSLQIQMTRQSISDCGRQTCVQRYLSPHRLRLRRFPSGLDVEHYIGIEVSKRAAGWNDARTGVAWKNTHFCEPSW